MNLENLYHYHTFIELFKILMSVYECFRFCPKNNKLLLMIPKVRLVVSQQNFVYRSSEIWNSLIKHVFSICNVEESGIIIPGSTANSDLSASVAFIKNKLRAKLKANQKTGRVTKW